MCVVWCVCVVWCGVCAWCGVVCVVRCGVWCGGGSLISDPALSALLARSPVIAYEANNEDG